MTWEWVSKIWTCQRVEAREKSIDFFPNMKNHRMYIMIAYFILVLGFASSEIMVKTNVISIWFYVIYL